MRGPLSEEVSSGALPQGTGKSRLIFIAFRRRCFKQIRIEKLSQNLLWHLEAW